MLTFLGTGGAFTKKNGNTLAYCYVDDNSLSLSKLDEIIP